MLDPAVETFLKVAETGSFTKAAEELYLSPTAVMKQMNQLEGRLGLQLVIRSPRGAVLTDAGKVLEKTSRSLLRQWERAVEEAKQSAGRKKRVLRIGTSALYPCGELIALWGKIAGAHLEFQFQVVPFDDAQTASIRRELGRRIDIMVGPFDSLLTREYCRLFPLGSYPFYVAMPRSHPFCRCKSLSLEDLATEKVMKQKPGNSPVNDRIRADLMEACPQITLVDAPNHFDLEVFNRAEAEGCLLIVPECWKDIHPSFVSVPLNIPHTLPYGVVYSTEVGEDTREFLRILKELLPQVT